jgi:hypothetical protein
MIFHSRRNYSATSNGSNKSFALFFFSLLLIPVVALVFCIYAAGQTYNPNSRFCIYQIYRQSDGTYQVWWECKTRNIEGTFFSYDDAKAFQVKKLKEIQGFLNQKPTGERSN